MLFVGGFVENVEIIALAHFSDSVLGSIARKQKRQVPRLVAERLEKLGLVKILNPSMAAATKREIPSHVIVGNVVPQSLLQAVQALRMKTSTLSEHSIVNQLQSTIPTAAQLSQTPCMPVTCNGGDTTVTLSEMIMRVSCGPKTKEPPKSTSSTISKAKTKRA